ncbi:prepilin-type N-terminal cleavage/methylation domain-containing protein [Candidatus Saccharibacteria bacterium]|nr:prepilin-type N-terminal cleavage/methylation domain-containing protein [Candidatus Saccharibacteria bacterium]
MNKFNSGFTLVEMLVVMAVIGILVTITYTGANAIFVNSKENEIQSYLTGARSKIEEYKKKEGVYPQFGQLPAGTVPASYANNYIYASSYGWAAAGTVYCLEINDIVGIWPSMTQINYHISSINTDPLPGGCNGFQQEALGNGLGGTTINADSQYGHIEVEAKTPLKGSFYLSKTNYPTGYVATALIRAAVYLDGTVNATQNLSQFTTYNCSGCGVGSFYLGAIDYGTPAKTAVVKMEWQDPVNGWTELVSATLP